MKNLFNILPIFIFGLSCKAQSPTIAIEDQNGDAIQNAYYKDFNNILNPFVGTYIYTNGSTSLKVILQKKTMSYDGYAYEDVLIGEYQYIKNGIEKVNTLNELNINYTNQSTHSITANTILSMGDYSCDGCSGNEKRLRGGLSEHATKNSAQLLIRKLLTNSCQPAIEINIAWNMKWYNPSKQASPPQPSFPGGNYLFIKL